uniref:Uncharacterized protein n=1 Tax=Sphaerodactylus townsendi TaxID=933632 RepID=A0ACB8F5U1_9SAUR
MKIQMSEKLEELKNTVPEKKSTLMENHLEMENTTSTQRNVNQQDLSSSLGNEVAHSNAQLAKGKATGRGRSTSRGRSASPKKLSNSTSRDQHQVRSISPRRREPKKHHKGCSDQPESPRRHIGKHPGKSENETIGRGLAPEKRGRSASPHKHPKSERSRDKVNVEQVLPELQSRIPANDRTSIIPPKDEKALLGEWGAVKENKNINISTKDENYPSGAAHTKSAKQSLPLSKGNQFRKKRLEDEKTKPSFEELNSNRFQMAGLFDNLTLSGDKNTRLDAEKPLNKFRDNDLEPADKTKEDGISKSEIRSPVKKTITPGPWKVPSTSKVTEAIHKTGKDVSVPAIYTAVQSENRRIVTKDHIERLNCGTITATAAKASAQSLLASSSHRREDVHCWKRKGAFWAVLYLEVLPPLTVRTIY